MSIIRKLNIERLFSELIKDETSLLLPIVSKIYTSFLETNKKHAISFHLQSLKSWIFARLIKANEHFNKEIITIKCVEFQEMKMFKWNECGKPMKGLVTNTLSSWFISLFPLKRGSFAKKSSIIQPTNHISTSVEYLLAPKSISSSLQST